MKKTTLKTLSLLAVPLLAISVVALVGSPEVAAQIDAGLEATGQDSAAGGNDVAGIIAAVVNAMLYVIGAAAVVMLIYGGIRYTTSGGNSASVTAAKNTIIYAVVGLIVAILAYAIVNWVIDLGGNL